MSYKIGFILSVIFIFQIFLLGSDILCVQVLYGEMDAAALTAEYMISKDGGISERTTVFIDETVHGVIHCEKNCSPRFGDALVFTVAVPYDPFIMSDQTMTLIVRRSAVIGYYN